MKWKLDRIVSIATLVTSVVALVLVLKRPQPVAPPMSPAAQASNAQSFEKKLEQLEAPKTPGQPPVEVHLSADELRAALAEAVKTMPAAVQQSAGRTQAGSNSPLQASANQSPSSSFSSSSTQSNQSTSANLNALGLPSGADGSQSGPITSADSIVGPGEPDVKDYQLNFEGDIAKGQFLTEIGGKSVWVTLAGHLASKDGYATFDPTEIKIGDLNVPVSLVNDALQKKLSEQRDRMKLPDNVGGFKVENGEMVMTQR
jgi:hypothetical protein